MIPLYQMEERVSVAMAQPTNHFEIRQAEELMGFPVSPILFKTWLNQPGFSQQVQVNTSHQLYIPFFF